MNVSDFEKHLYGMKCKLNADEGILFGTPSREITAIQVSWMANLEAIENAAAGGANLMLVHEALFLTGRGENSKDYLSWPGNYRRIKALTENGISVIRFHGTLDEICVFDDFAAALGLGEPVVNEAGYLKIYRLEPVPAGELAEDIKRRLKLDLLRVAPPSGLERKVSRAGLPWGGMCLHLNSSYQARLLRYKPDVFIAGEADSYAIHFAVDSGIVLIETGHEASENFGLKNFAEKLAGNSRGIPVRYFENRIPCIFK